MPDPITAVSELIRTIVDKVFPDKTQIERDKIALAMQQAQNEYNANTAQSDINKIEAASANLFVSGWRPGAGWVCVLGFGVQFLVAPLMTWITTLLGHAVTFPQLDMTTLVPLLMALLGLGGMRTYEKINGIAAGR